jgi:tetratricopeptide (TPR) repeat protein
MTTAETQTAAARRGPLAWILGLLLVALPLAGGWWYARNLTRPPTAPPRTPAEKLAAALQVVSTDAPQAKSLLREALDDSGGEFDDAELALATILVSEEQWEDAAGLFAQVDPAQCRSDLLLSFGRQTQARGKFAEALRALNPLREREGPESIAALEVLVPIHHDLKQSVEEVDCMQELAERDPREPARWWMLIDLLTRKQATHLVIEAMQEALKQELPEKDHRELHHRLIETLMFSGDATQARVEVDKLSQEEDPGSIRMLVHFANLHRMEGNFDLAMQSLERAIPQMGAEKFREAIRLRAILSLDLGKFADAARDLEQAIDEEPFDQVAHSKLGDAYRGLGNTEKADYHTNFAESIKRTRTEITRLMGLVEREPDRLETFDELAELHRSLNENDTALAWERRGRQARSRRRNPAPTPPAETP